MQKKPNEAVIMLCKCGHSHQTYGLRTEKLAKNHWRVNWAFPIRESAAKNEGYDKTSVKGNIEFTNEYPGCPYCGSHEMTLCTSCGHLTCTHPISGIQTCEWCGNQGELGDFGGDLAITAGMDY